MLSEFVDQLLYSYVKFNRQLKLLLLYSFLIENQRCERTSGLCKSLHELSTVIYVGIGGMSFVFVVLMCAVHWKQKRQGTRPSVTTNNAERTAYQSQQRPGQGTIRDVHVPALYNINIGTSDHNIYGESPPLYQCATANLPHDSSRMTSPSV